MHSHSNFILLYPIPKLLRGIYSSHGSEHDDDNLLRYCALCTLTEAVRQTRLSRSESKCKVEEHT
jgi:hypothetical protein